MKVQIGPQKIWKLEMKEEKKKNDAILKIIKENILDEVKQKRSQATIFRTPEYHLLQAKNTEINAHN